MARKQSVVVDLRVPVQLKAALEQIAKGGILGATVDEVVAHALRQYLFEMAQKRTPPPTEPA